MLRDKDNALPKKFCLSILDKYCMYEKMWFFLFYRQKSSELLQMIKFKYLETIQN